jgi:hypothetical protein
MLEDVLRSGFARAHQHLALVAIDLLWKVLWLAGTVLAVFVISMWFASALQSLAWTDTGTHAANLGIAVALARDFWNANKVQALWMTAVVLVVSAVAWLFLEAFARSRIVGQRNTMLFFASGSIKIGILITAAIVLIPVCIAGAVSLALVIFALLTFALTVLDTLIRSDAVELMGTDLIRVTSLVGILLAFETAIWGSFAVVVIAEFLNVARFIDALVLVAVCTVISIVLSILHSYLLLVRFFAVDIMRQNVVEV